MSATESINPKIEYPGKFDSILEKDSLYNKAISNSYTKDIPGKIEKLNATFDQFDHLQGRVDAAKAKDTNGMKVLRLCRVALMATALFIGTILTAGAIMRIILNEDENGDETAGRFLLYSSSLWSSEEIEERIKLKKLCIAHRSSFKAIGNTLDLRVNMNFTTTSKEPDYLKSLTVADVQKAYKRNNPADTGDLVAKMEQLQQRYSKIRKIYTTMTGPALIFNF